jgi:NifB/MoaA-like Fe-S oxidoreductase
MSIGIVPVGLTGFNKRKDISPVTRNRAKKVLEIIEGFKAGFGEGISLKVFLSDEFYLIAGMEIPSYDSYGSFQQINNGIGKSADFLNDIKSVCDRYKNITHPKKLSKNILIVTSEYGEKIMEEALKIIRNSCDKRNTSIYEDILIDILAVKNNFFSGNVKVTGLLTGTDISKKLSKKDTTDYTSVLIPDSVFNAQNLTLDGFLKQNIGSVKKNVKIIPEDGKSLMAEINMDPFN